MNLILYAVLALVIMGMIGTGVYKVKKWGGDEVRAEWAEVNRLAKEAADKVDETNRQTKEKADAANAKTKRDLAGLYGAYRSLRDQRRNGSLLPEAPADSTSPERITFDRKGFDSAVSGFDQGVTGLLTEGDTAIVDLNTAKVWAQNPNAAH